MKQFHKKSIFFEAISNLLFFKKKKRATNYAKILVFDFHLIGDMVLLTAFLEHLRIHFPCSKIHLVAPTWSDPILQNTNYVDTIHFFEAPWVKKQNHLSGIRNLLKLALRLRKVKFDLGIEMRGDLRQLMLLWLCNPIEITGFSFTGGNRIITNPVPDSGNIYHLLLHHKKILDVVSQTTTPVEEFVPKLSLSTSERFTVRHLRRTRQQSGRKIVGLHPFASSGLRMLDEVAIYDLIKQISTSFHVIIFFTKDVLHLKDQLIPPGLDVELFSGTLRQFIVQVASLDLFVGMDSGGGHIAAGLGVNVVSIFGPANDFYCKPIGTGTVTIVKLLDSEVPCRPCDQIHCTNRSYKKCLRDLSTKQIMGAIHQGIMN